jgi:hypothetical protein
MSTEQGRLRGVGIVPNQLVALRGVRPAASAPGLTTWWRKPKKKDKTVHRP